MNQKDKCSSQYCDDSSPLLGLRFCFHNLLWTGLKSVLAPLCWMNSHSWTFLPLQGRSWSLLAHNSSLSLSWSAQAAMASAQREAVSGQLKFLPRYLLSLITSQTILPSKWPSQSTSMTFTLPSYLFLETPSSGFSYKHHPHWNHWFSLNDFFLTQPSSWPSVCPPLEPNYLPFPEFPFLAPPLDQCSYYLLILDGNLLILDFFLNNFNHFPDFG